MDPSEGIIEEIPQQTTKAIIFQTIMKNWTACLGTTTICSHQRFHKGRNKIPVTNIWIHRRPKFYQRKMIPEHKMLGLLTKLNALCTQISNYAYEKIFQISNLD